MAPAGGSFAGTHLHHHRPAWLVMLVLCISAEASRDSNGVPEKYGRDQVDHP